jgi:hypothetical protein
MTSDITTAAFVFKKKYSDDRMGEHVKRDHVIQSKVKMKSGTIAGEDFTYVVRTGNPQGVGSSVSLGQNASTASKGQKFVTSPALKYGIIDIDGPSMNRAKGNNAAQIGLVSMETNGILDEVGDSLAFDFYRDGNGIRGQRASISGNVVTLGTGQARNFKEGMLVGASSNADGSSPLVGTTEVVSVDEELDKIELDDETDIGSFGDNDYLFRVGDPGNCVDGLQLLNPLVTPVSGTTFRGVDRYLNPTRLAGYRINNTAVRPEVNLGLLCVKIHNGGKKGRIGLVTPTTFWEISQRRDAKVEYDNGGGTAEYGFEYININTPGGNLKVFSDPDCPPTDSYVGSLETIAVHHLEKYIHVIKDDGSIAQRGATTDTIQIRTRCQSQVIMTLPGTWGVAAV